MHDQAIPPFEGTSHRTARVSLAYSAPSIDKANSTVTKLTPDERPATADGATSLAAQPPRTNHPRTTRRPDIQRSLYLATRQLHISTARRSSANRRSAQLINPRQYMGAINDRRLTVTSLFSSPPTIRRRSPIRHLSHKRTINSRRHNTPNRHLNRNTLSIRFALTIRNANHLIRSRSIHILRSHPHSHSPLPLTTKRLSPTLSSRHIRAIERQLSRFRHMDPTNDVSSLLINNPQRAMNSILTRKPIRRRQLLQRMQSLPTRTTLLRLHSILTICPSNPNLSIKRTRRRANRHHLSTSKLTR